MQDKLLIWDFDGVIADTEIIWLKNRMELLNERFNLGWNIETTNFHLGGKSDNIKREDLQKLGIITDEDFWNTAYKKDMETIAKTGFKLTDGIEEIFKIKKFAQCIATSGSKVKTDLKIKTVGIQKYFPEERVFTIDDVKHGKPAPDLFLHAAKVMGYKPENCIVVEDSIAGMTAATTANMTVITFIGSPMYHNDKYFEAIKKLGIKNIFYNMSDIKNFLEKL